MVQLQILNKILAEGSLGFVVKNHLSADNFFEYQDEYAFIVDHERQYGNVPDLATFLDRFPEFEVIDVTEGDDYLAGKAKEELAFHRAVPLVKKAYEMLEGNAFEAIGYLNDNLGPLLAQGQGGAIDLMADSAIREQAFEERMAMENHGLVTTGFAELDKILGGWDTMGESVTLFARPGVGKTWVLLKFLVSAWREGYRVGLYSGEMSANEIGYRVDSLIMHYSNVDLYRGTMLKGVEEYKEYLKKLREGGYSPFYVVTPEDLGGQPTVGDLANFAKSHNLELLGIDQYSKVRDGRSTKATDTRERLEHISADLRTLALRQHLIVLGVSQGNRNALRGVGKGGAVPELNDIYGSDAIGQDSSKVISLAQINDTAITLNVKKNRAGGGENVTLTYLWDKDHGTFTYQPSAQNPNDQEQVNAQYQAYGDNGGENVF